MGAASVARKISTSGEWHPWAVRLLWLQVTVSNVRRNSKIDSVMTRMRAIGTPSIARQLRTRTAFFVVQIIPTPLFEGLRRVLNWCALLSAMHADLTLQNP